MFHRILSSPVFRIVLIALALRVFSALLAFQANVVFPLAQPQVFSVFGDRHAFWDTFARYDTGWYRGIAMDGYKFVEGGRSNLAFFPVYPLAMRYAGWLLGGEMHHYYLGGTAVAWISFVVAMVLLFYLARMDLEEDAAYRAVAYCAVFPFAFFFGVAYSEATYLCLMLGTFLALRKKRWVVAGVVGAVAVVSRVNGIMAMPAFLWVAWRAAGGDRKALLPALGTCTLASLGFLAWCAYVYALSGSPFEWATSIERWGYHPGGSPWMVFVRLVDELTGRPYEFLTTGAVAPYDTLNGLAALAFVLMLPRIWEEAGTGYGLFMLANLLLPLSSGQFEGLGRYCAVMFPAFIWLAQPARAWLQMPLMFVFSSLYMLCLALFTKLHPIF